MKKRYISITFVALLGIALLFAGSACAAVDFPADEAGISAYVKAMDSVDLNDAKGAFATIERETSDYIIGTVALSLHTEEQYPHVYVSTDGWVVAYYPNDRPSSWILPWADYGGGELSSTTLSKAVGVVCDRIGGTTTGLKYYDFRHENASMMMIIVESVSSSTNFFKVTIPTTFSTYAVDWSHYNTGTDYRDGSWLYLNEAEIGFLGPHGTDYGSFLGQFDNGIEHTVKLIPRNYGHTIGRVALVLEYAE